MDRHDLSAGITAEQLAAAHLMDLEVQDKYNVRYINYWVDYRSNSTYCLVEAPSAEAAESVHREAHGLTASKILEVDPKRFEYFFGPMEEAEPGVPISNSAIRTILFTDIEGSMALTRRLGDEQAMKVLRLHDDIIKQAIQRTDGRLIKHTGDGMMACFYSVARAAQCSIEIQRGLVEKAADFPLPVRVRIGLTAGEPVAENDDLFGAAVQVAARICATCEPGGILGSSVVKELSLGKGLNWRFRGQESLPGLDEPLNLYELLWQT